MRKIYFAAILMVVVGSMLLIRSARRDWLLPEPPEGVDRLYLDNQRMTEKQVPVKASKGMTIEDDSQTNADDGESALENFPRKEVALVGDKRFVDAMAPGLAEEQLDFERLPPGVALPLQPMGRDALIWRAYKAAHTNPAIDIAAVGFDMLSGESALVRATGAVWMLEANGRLNASVIDQLIADDDVLVPLTAIGWMFDHGLLSDAQQFERRWQASQESWRKALDALYEESLGGMAGRAALNLVERSSLSAEEKTDLLKSVAGSTTLPYETRWEATMRLMGLMGMSEYQMLVADLLDLPRTDTPEAQAQAQARRIRLTDFHGAMMLLNQRVSGPEVALQQALVLTPDDADLFFAEESSIMLENLALWVEAATDRGLVSVRSGFTDAIRKHLESYPEDALPANQALIMQRIQVRLPNLRQMEK